MVIEKKFSYDQKKYNFVELVKSVFECEDLQLLHETLNEKYESIFEVGKDSDTVLHKIFYDKMRDGWPEFLDCYTNFIRDVIMPIVGDDDLIYQLWPSFRVHLPNNIAVGGWHKDADYHHPIGEINYIVALTPMFESNTTIAESEPGKMDFHQLELDPGQFIQFNGNQCIHGNLPNRTGVTRVSFDFRVMKVENYNASHKLTSMSKGSKFVLGDYYHIMSAPQDKS